MNDSMGRQLILLPSQPAAFSLVEVVLALGIVSFALLVLLALLPVGIQSTQDSLEETGAINVLSSLISDRSATPFSSPSAMYGLPALSPSMKTASNSFGVTAAETNTLDLSNSAYRVTYVFNPPTAALDAYQAYFKISWPATVSPANATTYVEESVTFSQP